MTGAGLTTDKAAAFEGARLGCGLLTVNCSTPGVDRRLAGTNAVSWVDETYWVTTGVPFTSTVAVSNRLFGFCPKFAPVTATCTGCAFRAICAVRELGEI